MMFNLISCVFSLLTTDDTDKMKYEHLEIWYVPFEASLMITSTYRYKLNMNLWHFDFCSQSLQAKM
jgi:hypothetical protein